jgi:hypothetical protein
MEGTGCRRLYPPLCCPGAPLVACPVRSRNHLVFRRFRIGSYLLLAAFFILPFAFFIPRTPRSWTVWSRCYSGYIPVCIPCWSQKPLCLRACFSIFYTYHLTIGIRLCVPLANLGLLPGLWIRLFQPRTALPFGPRGCRADKQRLPCAPQPAPRHRQIKSLGVQPSSKGWLGHCPVRRASCSKSVLGDQELTPRVVAVCIRRYDCEACPRILPEAGARNQGGVAFSVERRGKLSI